MADEQAFVFSCRNEQLIGILHNGANTATLGVLVIVGGPQYRVGSHRQFVLFARTLAANGIPVLRFDYRGMGDASGDPVSFEQCDPDIRAALDEFFARSPDLQKVVLWGLCDAASAALRYAWQDARVDGLVLLNPWVRTEEGFAKTQLKHYYLRRLFNREFWNKVLRGQWRTGESLGDFAHTISRSLPAFTKSEQAAASKPEQLSGPLPERMASGLERFSGPVLLILSGQDLTADEFCDVVQQSPRWQKLLQQADVQQVTLATANHTFSSQEWRNEVANSTLRWIDSWQKESS